MSASSDIAELTSLRTQLSELRRRVSALTDRYRSDPDAPLTSDLFGAERQLGSAARHLDRAASALDNVR